MAPKSLSKAKTLSKVTWELNHVIARMEVISDAAQDSFVIACQLYIIKMRNPF